MLLPALFLLLSQRARSAEPALEFRLAGAAQETVPLKELLAKVKHGKITFFSPFAGKDGKDKNYGAFALKDLLEFAYGDKLESGDYSDVAFIALDGYQAVGPLDKLREGGGYLAFQDLDRKEGWEPVGSRKQDPGPFFVVWTEKGKDPEHAYPWPWQVTALNLIRFEDQYPAVVPKGAARDSAAYRGYQIFKARCIRCHSIDQEGGKIGPDLNAPQSVTAYRSEKMVKEFIRNPSKYRYTYMPDHSDLSDRDLDDLYRYLLFKGKEKRRAW